MARSTAGDAIATPGLLPALQGSVIGVLLLFGFSAPPLIQLKRVSTLRVLRREFSSGSIPPSRLLAGYAVGFAALAGLMFWIAGEVRLGAYVVGGFSVAMLLFALVARVVIRFAALLRGGARPGARQGASVGATAWPVLSGIMRLVWCRSSPWHWLSWRCSC